LSRIRRFWPFISKSFLTGIVIGGAAVGALAAWISNGA
jgi:hypothetical protein